MAKFLKYLLALILLALVLASASWLALWRIEKAQLLSVQTGSMEPALKKGDLAINVKAQPDSIKPGDIVSYFSLEDRNKIVTHRVIQANPSQGYFVTKGDNLSQPDPAVPYSALNGKTVKSIPKLGYFFDLLHKPVGLVAFVYLPALAVATFEMWILASHYKNRPYQLI